jgi:anthranilate phosphoribosyltransferase
LQIPNWKTRESEISSFGFTIWNLKSGIWNLSESKIMPKPEWLLAASVSATNSKADTPLFPFLTRLVRGEDLSFNEAADFFRALTDKNANPAQIAGALVALSAKGETFVELAAMARVMREQAVRIDSRHKHFIDTTGTGSSASKTFNVSTAAAFVAAGAGLAVAKQSNRHVSSKTGSADILEKLGVKISAAPKIVQACLNGAGLCFIYAPKFHPTLKHVGEARASLGIRSCLNLLGVLANPANAPQQLVGVWHESLIEPVAQALALLDVQRAWVVHGADALDEITLTGETTVAEVFEKKSRIFKISPKDFGLPTSGIEHLKVEAPEQSAEIIREVLNGKRRDEARSLVVINAAAALVIGGIAKQPIHAARLAEQSIDSGQAQNKLDRLIQTTNK